VCSRPTAWAGLTRLGHAEFLANPNIADVHGQRQGSAGVNVTACSARATPASSASGRRPRRSSSSTTRFRDFIILKSYRSSVAAASMDEATLRWRRRVHGERYVLAGDGCEGEIAGLRGHRSRLGFRRVELCVPATPYPKGVNMLTFVAQEPRFVRPVGPGIRTRHQTKPSRNKTADDADHPSRNVAATTMNAGSSSIHQ